MPNTPDDIPSVNPVSPRAYPVRYPLPPRSGGGIGRVLLILLLLGSIALNVLLLCGGLLIRGFGSTEHDYAALAVNERFLGGSSAAADKVAVVRIEGTIMEGLLAFPHKQIEEAAK